MTNLANPDRNHESIVNDTLARIFREKLGLSASAETLHNGKRPDIIVGLPEGPVILETEFAPALTVEADALSRLGMEINGQKVQNVFAVTVPGKLRSTSQQHLYDRMAGETLVWQEWRIDGTSGPTFSGTAVELGNVVQRVTPPAGGLDEAVDASMQGLGAPASDSIPHPERWADSRKYSAPNQTAMWLTWLRWSSSTR